MCELFRLTSVFKLYTGFKL